MNRPRKHFSVSMRHIVSFISVFLLLFIVNGVSAKTESNDQVKLEKVLVFQGKHQVETVPEAVTPSPISTTFDFDKIFVVNVKERTDRRQLVQAQMDHHGIQVEFKEAQTPDSNLTKWFRNHEDLSTYFHQSPSGYKELALFASYVEIFQDILKHGYQRTLILEDDVDVDARIRHRLPLMLEDLRSKSSWDLLLLGHCAMQHSTPFTGDWHTTNLAYCTHAFAVSFHLVERFMEQFQIPRHPVDIEFLPFCIDDRENCKAFVAVPPLFVQIAKDRDNPSIHEDHAVLRQELEFSTMKEMNITIRNYQIKIEK